MTTASLVNLRQSLVAFAAEIINLSVQTTNHLRGFLDRSTELVRLALPSANAVDLSGSASQFGLNLLAKLAFGPRRNCLHDELHATRLADPVLLGTVLAEVAPPPVATGKSVLVKEAHVSRLKSWDV
jgi:hypothetical protein